MTRHGILLKLQVINTTKEIAMKLLKSLTALSVIVFITACTGNSKKEAASQIPQTITQKVDGAVNDLDGKISSYKLVAKLDHHRMAAEAGVYTPPSIVTIFSDSKVEVPIIQANQLAALDMPFKVLSYAEADTMEAKVAYTSAGFIQKRHSLDAGLLTDYTAKMNAALTAFPEAMISETDLMTVSEGFGIIKTKSDFDFATTVKNLKDIIMSQGDTKWFADVDFQKDAAAMDITIEPNTLLLFGGPAPGGKAMMTSPKIGLDAFCQKLLVFQKENGEVWIAYNDIVAFAQLYYQNATKPQQMINHRLTMVFTKAVSN